MDMNLDHERIADMFFGLTEEVFKMYDLPHIYFPDFSIGKTWKGLKMPKEAMAGTAWFSAAPNAEVRLVEKFIPYLYEDEVICTLLHEIAHAVVAQAEADSHGPIWAEVAKEIGSVPQPFFTPRHIMDYHWLTKRQKRYLSKCDLTPTLGYL